MARTLVSGLLLGLLTTSACDCNNGRGKGRLLDLADQPDSRSGDYAPDLTGAPGAAELGSAAAIDLGNADDLRSADLAGADLATGPQKPACNGSIVLTVGELGISSDVVPCDLEGTVEGVDWRTLSQSPGELCPQVSCKGYLYSGLVHLYNGKLTLRFDDLPCRVERAEVQVSDNAGGGIYLYDDAALLDSALFSGSTLQTVTVEQPGAEATHADIQLCSGDFSQITLY